MTTGQAPERDRFGQPIRRPKSRKEEYKEKYEARKQRGETFYPFTLFKDGVTSLVIFLIILGLAYFLGAETEAIADPTDTTYNPRPEWYFLFLFELLKYFPGSLEPVAAVLLPGAVVVLLLLLPFIDRSPFRHPLNRPLAAGIGLLSLGGIVVLTYLGASAEAVNVPTMESPLVVEGKRLYRELNCAYCHTIEGSGGFIGPDLTYVASRRSDPEWLKTHFRDPQAVVSGSRMPQLQLLEDEVNALTAYMLTLGPSYEYSEEAPKLFKQQCALCHTIDGSGGTMGPDLSDVGKRRTVEWIRGYVENPSALSPGATMPGFREKLSREQVEDIARYLANMRGE